MIDVGSLTWTDLRKGTAIQSRIIGALVMREIRTRFGNYQFGYAWALIEPLIQIGILVVVFTTLLGRHPPLGTSYEIFFLTGFVPYWMFNQISSNAAQAITANRGLLTFPPVRNMDTVWARILLEAATGVTALLVLMAIFAYLDIPVIPHDTLQFGFGFLSAMSLGAGTGILNAALNPIFQLWSRLYAWFSRVQYFVSGVFFLPDVLPPGSREILAWNPLAHSIMWIREGFYDGYNSFILEKYYPIMWAILMATAGLVIERVFRRQVDAI